MGTQTAVVKKKINEKDYSERVNKIIIDGDFEESKNNPLTLLIKRETKLRLKISSIFSPILQWHLKVSNPKLPRLYALPKIHKPGTQMRQIVSNIGSPAEKLAKWLLTEFEKIPQPPFLSIKNSYDRNIIWILSELTRMKF